MNEQASYLTEFGVLEFTSDELLTIPEVEQKFLLTASLITNDIRFHWSLMARAKVDGKSDEIKTMQAVRDLWALRKLSSVIHEADIALNGFIKKSALLQQIIESRTRVLQRSNVEAEAKIEDGYLELARLLRNRSAYHYGVGNLAENIKGFAKEAKHTLFAHQQQGNSISALCEQIITLPTIRNAFDGAHESGFHEWCMKSSNSILHFCNTAIAEVVTQRIPDKMVQMKEVMCDNEAAPPSYRWPLFLVVDKTSQNPT